MTQLLSLLLTGLLVSSVTFADEEAKLSHESEAGVVLATGNSDVQTYNLKQTTDYQWTGNTIKFTGSYLLGKTAGTESAKKWDLGLRYDRKLTEDIAAFLGYQIDGNIFSGFESRHTVDLGAKYQILKMTEGEIGAEGGYRLMAENQTSGASLTSHMTRIYAEWKWEWSKSLKSKVWVEYLQSFSETSDYRFNAEPSLSMILSAIFSVKLAYLINFRNVPAAAGKQKTDSLFTTALVAKF